MTDDSAPIVIRFGDMTLDFGVGTIPLIFLRFYRYIEGLNGERLRDAEAMLLVQVMALRANHDFELRLANLPMAQSNKSLERYLAKFRRMGIVFTSRIYYSRSEMQERFGPGNLPGTPCLKAQRWDLSPLFLTLSLIGQDWLEHQQAVVAEWKAQGEQGPKPIYGLPDNYIRQVELPFEVAQRILNEEYFPAPPDYILDLAEHVCSLVPPQSGVVRAHVPPQSGVVQTTYHPKVGWSSITATATAGGEIEIFQLFLRCAEIDRDPTGEELEIIRQLLASGIPQETIQAGIEQAFRTRRQADGIPTLAQCARVARRLHHREHREHDAETTDRIPAADHTTGTIAASGLAAHADPLADVWAALREGSCPECNYDTAAYRLGLRHLAGDAEQVYRAVIETIAYGVPPDRLVGYVRSILDRWAAEAQGAMVEVDAARAADGSPTLSENAQGSGAAEEQVWKTALVELRHQMTKATFDTWLCGTRLVQCADSVATIAVRSEYARDWLANRLRPVVARTLSGVLGHQVEVQFVVNDQARLSVGSA